MGRKIAIIGAGAVGSSIAFSLMMKNLGTEILMNDVNEKRCEGEVLDLSDSTFYASTSLVRKCSSKEVGQADIIIITAGAAQKPGETRTDLISKNFSIITSVFGAIKPLNPDAIVILVANPVDIITLKAQEVSGLPRNQVIGTGTFLDSQRLRLAIAKKLNLSETSIHAVVLGEHGDSQFPQFSAATIGGIGILDYPGITRELVDSLAEESKKKAYKIIECKGATYYGIGACTAAICENIIHDQRTIKPLSVFNEKYQVCLSVPVVVGKNGVELQPLVLDAEETQRFENSALKMKEVLDSIPG